MKDYNFEVWVKVKGVWNKWGYSKTNDAIIYREVEEEVFNCEEVKIIKIGE